MEPRRLLEELRDVAKKAKIEVRTLVMRVPVRTPGGLCRVNGRQVIMLDARGNPLEQCITLAEALLLTNLDLDGADLSSDARTFVMERKLGIRPTVRSVRRTGPGVTSTARPRRPGVGVRPGRSGC